jgi:cell division transport system permease protein
VTGLVELLRGLSRASRGAYAQARGKPLIQLVAVGTIALALLLVGAVKLATDNAGELARRWGGDVQLVLYLDDEVGPERAAKLVDAVGRLPGVEEPRLITPRAASERARKSLGARAALLDGVEEGFFPASIEVVLKPGIADVLRVHPAFARLKNLPGVEEVELLGDWATQLRGAHEVLARAGWLVAALVAWACLFIVAATIRLAVFARREEIAILKLVGATDAFVKAPFLIEGAVQGAAGATLALGLLYGLHQIAGPPIAAALDSFLAAGPLRFFALHEMLLTPVVGATLGLAGSALALGRYVRV